MHPGCSGGRLPRRSTEEKGREEGEVDEGGEERRIRSQLVEEVAAGSHEKVSMHDGVKNDVKRRVELSFALVEQKMDILERTRMEGSPVQFEVTQNAPELFVHERMSQGIG